MWALFHTPPDEPKQLECVTCRVGLGGAALAVTGVCSYGLYKVKGRNVYVSFAYGFVGLVSLAAAAVSFKAAKAGIKQNEILVERWLEEKQEERKVIRERMRQINMEQKLAQQQKV